jgi:hypothetical protein
MPAGPNLHCTFGASVGISLSADYNQEGRRDLGVSGPGYLRFLRLRTGRRLHYHGAVAFDSGIRLHILIAASIRRLRHRYVQEDTAPAWSPVDPWPYSLESGSAASD